MSKEELQERLEDARGGGNPGDIEAAVWAIADSEISELRKEMSSLLRDILNADGYEAGYHSNLGDELKGRILTFIGEKK
jgi:hypothetical protein